MTVSAETRLRLFLQGDLWNQSDCENDKPPKATSLCCACCAGSAPSVLRFALVPCASKEKRIHLDYWGVVLPILSGVHVHAVSSSSYIRLRELLLFVSYYLLYYDVISWNPQSITVYLWYRGECWQQYRLYLMVKCIFGRFQRFSSIGTMFGIRHHPIVSLFNNIPQNCDRASGFPFCLHSCRSRAYVGLRHLGLWETIRNDSLSSLFSWNINVGDFLALCIWMWDIVQERERSGESTELWRNRVLVQKLV